MADLAGLIAKQGSDLRLRQAIVTAAPSAGVATIRFGDLASTTTADDIPGVHMLTSADVANGATVWVLQTGGALLIVGEVGPASAGRYYSLVGRSTNVAVTSGAVHTVDFNTVVSEDQPFFNNAANTWTLPESGLWELQLQLTYISDVNTATDSTAIWNIDGNSYEGTRGVRPVNSGVGVYSNYTAPIVAGQVVTPQGFITATNPVLLGDTNTLRYCRAAVRRLGPLP